MKILQLTVHFSPNMGGVETHLDDLVTGLIKLQHKIFVLTYRPLSVRSKWNVWENSSQLMILRLPWIAGWFNKLSNLPIAEFLYLVPGLFITLPFIILFFRPNVIHSHGLSAGFVGAFWGKIFRIHTVVSTHSIYHFPSKGVYKEFAKWVFQNSNFSICLSNQSVSELLTLGISPAKVGRFIYWVDLNKYKPLNKIESKKKLNWTDRFVVLFVGRLVPEKGIIELLEAAKQFNKNISLKIAGSGPLESLVKEYSIGRIAQSDLPIAYSAADVVIVPSIHDEGFGRVIIEALACGTPVVAAKRGAIPEAMDESVGMLINITPKNIATNINMLFSNKKLLEKISMSANNYARDRYSAINIHKIVNYYK